MLRILYGVSGSPRHHLSHIYDFGRKFRFFGSFFCLEFTHVMQDERGAAVRTLPAFYLAVGLV
jgi:hypothetical protein